jgi:CRP/FNR family transcriptional regulator, cyclic AMP receptor protein
VLTAAAADAREARSILAELFPGGRHREVSRGAAVMLQGEAGSTVARIVAGRVKIVHSAPSGDGMLLAIVGPGEIVGDFEAFEPSPAYRRGSVVALDAVTLHTVSAEDYLAFLHTHPAAAIERLRAVIVLLRASGRRRTEWISMRATKTTCRATRRDGRDGILRPRGDSWPDPARIGRADRRLG